MNARPGHVPRVRSQQGLFPRLSAVIVLVASALAGLAAFKINAERSEREWQSSQQVSRGHVQLINYQLRYLADSILAATSVVVTAVQKLDPASELDEMTMHKILETIHLAAPIVQVAAVDRNGWSLAYRHQYPTVPIDLRDRKHVKVFLEEGRRKLFISPPVVGRASNIRTVQFAVPVFAGPDPQAPLKFILVISTATSSFDSLAAEISDASGQVVMIIGTDGYVRFQAAGLGLTDVDLSTTGIFRNLLAIGTGPFDLVRSGIVDTSRRVGYVALEPDLEMIITASRSAESLTDALSAFRLTLAFAFLGGVAVAIMAIGLASTAANRKILILNQKLLAVDAAILSGVERLPNVTVVRDAESLLSLADSVPGDDPIQLAIRRPSLIAFVRRALTATSQAPTSSFVDRFQMPDGAAEHHWTAISYFGLNGLPKTAVIGIDRTSGLRNEHKLYQMAKLATLGEMAAAMAHELTQPFNVIALATANFSRVAATLPAENGSLEAAKATILAKAQRIQAAVRRGSATINHMRAFGRDATVDSATSTAAEIFEGLQSMLSARLKSEGCSLMFQEQPDLPRVACPANLVEQVLLNLINNAADSIAERQTQQATKHDGRIQVRVTRDNSLERPGVRFSVEDNGTGIPPAVAARLFEPFFTTKPRGKGTGLGLSVSFSIVRGLNGTIELEKSRDGATFALTLPAVAAPDQPPG